MKLCPKNAKYFNHHLTPEQAKEWCRNVTDKAGCKGCELAPKEDGKKVKKPVKQQRLF